MDALNLWLGKRIRIDEIGSGISGRHGQFKHSSLLNPVTCWLYWIDWFDEILNQGHNVSIIEGIGLKTVSTVILRHYRESSTIANRTRGRK